METQKIQLPMSLAIKVNEILAKKGLPKRIGLNFTLFNLEELQIIKSLRFENPKQGDLDGISLLPNLKSLSVHSENKWHTVEQQIVSSSISKEDVEQIYNCKFLKSLSLVNQSDIENINTKQLPKLEELEINFNENLRKVTGGY